METRKEHSKQMQPETALVSHPQQQSKRDPVCILGCRAADRHGAYHISSFILCPNSLPLESGRGLRNWLSPVDTLHSFLGNSVPAGSKQAAGVDSLFFF